MLTYRFLRVLALVVIGLISGVSASVAQEDISFEADSVAVNDDDGSLFATGNVLMRQAGMTLRADEVRYNKTDGRAVASGDVSFTATDGTVHKSDVKTQDSEFTHIVAESY